MGGIFQCEESKKHRSGDMCFSQGSHELLFAGATKRSQTPRRTGSALGGLMSFLSPRSTTSTRSTSTMASVSEAPVPQRSCLAKKKMDEFDMATDEQSVESVWV